MAIVTRLQEMRGIVQVDIDGVLSMRIRKKHFEKKPLRIGDAVEAEEYLDSIAGIQFQDAYEAALCGLDRSAKTAAELRRGLERQGYVHACAEAVIQRLEANGLLDDKAYAMRLTESQMRRPVGAYAMRQKLRAKGISEEDAEEVMRNSMDEEQQLAAAKMAAEKLYRKYCDLPARECRAKLGQALARRGFAWDIARQSVDSCMEDDDTDEL